MFKTNIYLFYSNNSRSGLVGGPQRDVFLVDLVNWIVSKKFSKVILLTSTEADERLDSQIGGSQFRFISKHFENDLKALEFLELEKRQDEDIFIPGKNCIFCWFLTKFESDFFESNRATPLIKVY